MTLSPRAMLRLFLPGLMICTLWLAAAVRASGQSAAPKATTTPASREAGLAAWQQVYSVLTHPRCINCHTATSYPQQGDDRYRHFANVIRGREGKGVPGLNCLSCHQEANADETGLPGAPNWHLAPLSMGWEGLSDSALCRVLKDTRNNGGKSIDALVHHMTDDPLVQWAWSPGGRVSPPLDG